MERTSINVPFESLTYPLRESARRFPEKSAVILPESGGEESSYRWIDDRTSKLAASLANLGVEPGDRIGLWMKNSLEYILSFYGILKAGAIVVPVSTHYGSRELFNQLDITNAKGLIAQESLLKPVMEMFPTLKALRLIVAEGAAELPQGTIDFNSLINGSNSLDRSIGIDTEKSLAVIPFSSGTTGLPKGVMLTHRNLLSNLYQVIQAHEVTDKDVMINQLPFFHIYGMTVLMGNSIMAGATQIVVSRIRPLDDFLDLFEKFKPTLFFTAPLVIQAFCHHPRVSDMDWSRLRYVNTGGAPLSPELQKRFTKITGVPVMQGYGLTESSPTTHVNPIRRIRVGSIGMPLADTEDKIADPLNGYSLPTNEVGELWIRGPQVMKGYYQDFKSTDQTIVDGWLRTGDLAKKDEDGYVYIVDRLKELIKTKGYQVAPAEIEHVLVGHADIEDAAVVGEPHPEFGEVPVAYVVLHPNSSLSGEEIIAYASNGMAKYKRLARVEFRETIPRSPSGKILRRVLKQQMVTVTF